MTGAAALFILVTQASAGSAEAQPTGPSEGPTPEIVVSAPKEEGEEIVPLGSRIARHRAEAAYRQVGSDTGVQGLTPGSGMDPFAGPTRYVEITSCRSSDPALGAEAACALAAASAHMEEGEWEDALPILYRLSDDPASAPGERYVAARFFYRIAVAEDDALGRQQALEQMLATGAMTDEEAVAARKTLIALALRERDDASAIKYLEALLEAHPEDSRSQANLAALYAQAGSHDKALPHMEKAVALLEQAGRTPPHSWTDYLRSHRR